MGRPARFERGAVLAWAVDVDRGYRQAAGVEWAFAELRSRPGADGLAVADVVDQELPGPSVRIEPLEDGKLELRSETPLVIQAYGEEQPSRQGTAVEVPYGSVVRAGPLLLAPLYAEQLESVREGRMSLPVVPLVSGLSQLATDDGDDDLDAALRARRIVSSRWAAAWGLAFVATPFVGWGLTYLAAALAQRRFGFWYPYFEVIVAFVIAQCVSIFSVGLPIHVAMIRWKRTPGASEGLAPRCDQSSRGAVTLAVASASATLLVMPWLLGLSTLVIMDTACLGPGYRPTFLQWAGMGAGLGVVMSMAYGIFAFIASRPIHRLAVRWLAAVPRSAAEP